MIFVNDIILLLISWTLVSVASYALIGIKKDEKSLEGAAKYALMGILATAFMIYGIAFIFGLSGSTQFPEIAQYVGAFSSEPLIIFAFIMFIASFGFKIGAVPFHGWMPDVYGGAHPLPVSFIAGVVKIAGFVAIFRFLYPMATSLGDIWLGTFSILSIVTMSFGNISALVQSNVQRMMAYSSIAQAGYILLGFAAATGTGFQYGIQGIALHLSTYMLAKVGLFVGFSYLSRKNINLDLEGFSGLGRTMPVTSISITVLLLSLIGVPPLLGFWSKFLYLIFSTIPVAPWLTLIAVLNSGISIVYYIQIIRYMFFIKGQQNIIEGYKDPEVFVLIIAMLITIILGLGLAPIIASNLFLT